MIEIWTTSLSRWREAERLQIPLLDITAKSGIKAFAPDYKLVMDYKANLITEAYYEQKYIERMRSSFSLYPDIWSTLKNKPQVALACYCGAGKYCHRHVFKILMEKYLNSVGYSVVQKGEL